MSSFMYSDRSENVATDSVYSDSEEEEYYRRKSFPSSDEGDKVSKKNPGLNMEHGFLYHIRKNQIDRDNYDKQKKTEVEIKKKRKAKKNNVEKNLYVPRKSLSTPSAHAAQKIDNNNNKALFRLHYTDSSMRSHFVVVKKDDDPAKVGESLAQKANIPPELIQTLIWKINSEKEKITNLN